MSSICLAGFGGYLVASFAASSYVNSPENWLFIASYLAMVPALSVLGHRSNLAEESNPKMRPEGTPELKLSKGTADGTGPQVDGRPGGVEFSSSETFEFDDRTEVLRMNYLAEAVKGKRVVHVGCVDHLPLLQEEDPRQ